MPKKPREYGSYRRLTKEEQHRLRAAQIAREGGEINPKDIDTQLTERIGGYIHRERHNPEPFTLEEFKAKFGTNPICYLTGIPLDYTDGYSFHLDHYVPVSKGGKSNLENLRLCSAYANRVKRNLSHSDFVKLCRAVVAYHDKLSQGEAV